MLRVILAFLLAPFPAALMQALLVALWPLTRGAGIYQHPASMFVAMCVLHYAFGLVLGVPLYLALRRRSLNRLLFYVLAGTGIVLVPMALWLTWAAWGVAVPASAGALVAYAFLRFGISGALTGATFWLLARPDRREARRRATTEKKRLSGAFE